VGAVPSSLEAGGGHTWNWTLLRGRRPTSLRRRTPLHRSGKSSSISPNKKRGGKKKGKSPTSEIKNPTTPVKGKGSGRKLALSHNSEETFNSRPSNREERRRKKKKGSVRVHLTSSEPPVVYKKEKKRRPCRWGTKMNVWGKRVEKKKRKKTNLSSCRKIKKDIRFFP